MHVVGTPTINELSNRLEESTNAIAVEDALDIGNKSM